MIVSYQSPVFQNIIEKVKSSIIEQGLKVVEYYGVVPNPLYSKAVEGIEIARAQNVGFVLGIGGGSSIDTAKAIALGYKLKSELWDVYTGKAGPNEILPIGVISTIAATGSETSPFAVLTNTDAVKKIGYGCSEMRPKFALLNPELTYSVPSYQTVCGACDMFAHICDAYLGRVEDMALTYRMSESVMKTVVEYVQIALKTPENYEARSQLMLCGTLAMGKFASMGLDTNLGLHTMAEDLGAVYNVTHGEILSILLPAWMTYLKKDKFALLIRYANEVWGIETNAGNLEETIDAGIQRTKEFFVSLGMKSSLRELGIDFEKDGKMLADRLDKHGDYGDAYIHLTPDVVYEIYKMVQ